MSPLGSLRAAMAPFRPEALLIAWTTSAEVLAARLVGRSFPRIRISLLILCGTILAGVSVAFLGPANPPAATAAQDCACVLDFESRAALLHNP